MMAAVDWQSGRWAWRFWAVACVVAVGLCAWAWSFRAGAAQALAELHAAEAARERSQALPQAMPAAPQSDFTAALPAELPDGAAAARRLQGFCVAAGVALSALTVAQHVPTAASLGRLELDVEMSGSYRAIKQVLAQWSEGQENTTVRMLRLASEGAEPGVVQARAVLALWSRALPEGAASSPSTGRPVPAGR